MRFEEPAEEPVSSGALLRVGWKEYVAFPEWGLKKVRAKIDTGAYSSVLDAVSYEIRETANGTLVAHLCLAPKRRHPERLVTVETPVLRMVTVRNSGGLVEKRPLVEALIRLGPLEKRIRMTVTNRVGMRYRMLLGRHALASSCVVDVSRKYLLQS
jgi:hypothetical protein